MKVYLWIILGAVILKTYQLFVTTGIKILQTKPEAIDFLAFYTGATLFAHGDMGQIYLLDAQRHLQQALLPIDQTSLFFPFLNPPFTLLFFLPFAYLPLQFAYALIAAINFLLVGVLCFVSLRQISSVAWYKKSLVVLGIATFLPVLTTLLIGQLSLLLALIILLSWLLIKHGKQFTSGFLLSFLLIKPHFFILPFLAILIQRQKRLSLGLLSGTLFLVLLSFLLVGVEGISQYFILLQTAMSWESGFSIDLRAQHSLQTALLFLTNSLDSVKLLWLGCSAFFIITTLFIWCKKYPPTSWQFGYQWAILIIATLLISPHTHFHDLTLLLTVAIIFLSLSTKPRDAGAKHYLLGLSIIGYLIALLGYLLAVSIDYDTRGIWIITSVMYMVLSWGILSRTLLFPHHMNSKKSSDD